MTARQDVSPALYAVHDVVDDRMRTWQLREVIVVSQGNHAACLRRRDWTCFV